MIPPVRGSCGFAKSGMTIPANGWIVWRDLIGYIQ
jgi:hypothetical protein